MPARQDNRNIAWAAGWALAATILILGSWQAALTQDFAEPDNAMRLVRVRDFLGGQGWFDQIQYRLNPPDGTPMHWARWLDAAIAAPIALLAPLIGQQAAEIAVAFAWPLALLAVFMALVVSIAGQLGERDGMRREAQWAAAIVAALAFPATEKFAPGSFDHHNIELILGLAAILGLMRMREHPRSALWAGAALGLAMATAAEGAPLVVTGLVVAGLLWLVRPADFAKGLMWLGAGLAGSSALMFGASVPPAEWGRPVCDALGAPFLGFALAGGGVAALLSISPPVFTSTLWRRLAASAVLGGVAVAILALLFPSCIGGGYASLGADMEALWMSQISETRSLIALAGDDPAMILTVAGAALAGLVAGVVFLRRHWRNAEGWVVLAFLLVGWVVLAWQIRGATFATAFAIPFGAWAVAKARRDYHARATAIRALAFAGIAASSAAAAWASAGEALQARLTSQRVLASYEARTANAKSCLTPEAFKPLVAIAPSNFLNQFSLAGGVLVWTQHGVLAGPYHRDVVGTMTMINAMRSSPDEAKAIVLGSAADHVLVCPAAPETRFYARRAMEGLPESTLSAMLGRGEHPDWLAPVPLADTPLRLYRVIR